ncbi:hypothetical protein DCS_03511 [Drechmeria coniospora]|uniref:Major facilitator superfamily (MFS) profile domain-containing protein n=1 Tax=Drechmeria coniospora TaxID=98403 RepID=A0A151GHI6_DRECN|nr:hypothetical protein DCS_03511 [Drechmeria coniospora]KYK56511.1 hypothetical protein DCS_03511 [Drechmeria coniospora]ODA76953.1 hypothetical protein RJ55_07469 [Drechmeria coniospora]
MAPTSERQRRDAAETTPLLADGRLVPDADADTEADAASSSDSVLKDGRSGKPLPKGQIFLLCYARVMEPIAFFSIFPYIAQMVQRNGHLPESDVGFYSGLIESLFSAAQMVVLLFWGGLADRLGRKPVLVTSLVGMVVGPALFGLSRTIGQMILFRCLAGVFSGSSLVIRTMISDHCTADTQAVAFSWFAFAGNVGIFLGPLIGGALADPATQYPSLFGAVRFFADYPFALPGFVVGAICATSTLTSLLYLEETLDGEPAEVPGDQERRRHMSIWQLVRAPGVAVVLCVYGHVMLLAFAYTAVLPVVLFTPVALGGLGCDSFQISLYMAALGASQALWTLLVFPVLHRRVGTVGVLRLCAACYPFFFAGFVVMNLLLREGTEASVVCFWVIGTVVCFGGPGVSMAFTAVQLALNEVSPDQHHMGTLNAIALTCTSGIRSVAPAVTTAMYAVGVRGQILGGHLVWALLVPISAALLPMLRWFPRGKD